MKKFFLKAHLHLLLQLICNSQFILKKYRTIFNLFIFNFMKSLD